MRLESALYSSQAGLEAHGQAISVIGDNVSNANTTGYKSSRTEFADLLGDQSGTVSVGAGARIQRVRQIHETGIIEDTGRSLDMAIAGNGFFVVGDDTQQYFTRSGVFAVGLDGNLIDAEGKTVLGYSGATSEELGEINMVDVNLAGQATSTGQIFGNLDASQTALPNAPTNPDSFLALGQGSSFQANMTVYDSLGAAHNITVATTKTATNTWVAQAFIDGGDVGGTAGQPVQIGQNVTLNFGSDGSIPDANKAAAVITCAPAYGNGSSAGNFTINLGEMSQYSAPSQLLSVNQDGKGVGNISDYNIDNDGKITAVLDSGVSVLIGRLPVAMIRNVDGLERVGNSLYALGATAGDVDYAQAGAEGAGEIKGSALERSTVDIANQFINLVLYQRGYQANSQTLNATNSLIQNTIGLIR